MVESCTRNHSGCGTDTIAERGAIGGAARSSPHVRPLRTQCRDQIPQARAPSFGADMQHARRVHLGRGRTRRDIPRPGLKSRSRGGRTRPSAPATPPRRNRHRAVIPRSMTRLAPVMKPASSEARKTMPLAMSLTVPIRPIGSRPSAWRRASSMSLVLPEDL